LDPLGFYVVSYETRMLLEWGMPRCQIPIVSKTDTYDYIELCHFSQIVTGVDVSVW